MDDFPHGTAERVGTRARHTLGRVELLALFPLVVLAAEILGFENIALVTALGLSSLLALAMLLPQPTFAASEDFDTQRGKAGLIDALESVCQDDGQDTACILLQIDDWQEIVDKWGHDSSQSIAQRVKDRLQTTLRAHDRLCQLGDARFGIVLDGMPAARLGIRDSVATRLSDAIAEPMPIQGATMHPTIAMGHASIRRRAANPAEATFKAAEAALSEAIKQGRGTIRAYADGMGRARNAESELAGEVEEALHSGEIDTWFQPQICARTGVVTGMETFARWQHPQHGLLGPSEIMPALRIAGHISLLGQTLTHRAIKALSELDAKGPHLPSLSINLSEAELQDPTLPGTIADEVQRYGLSADRIIIEISNDIAAHERDDSLIENLVALRTAGHRLDLEGVGSTAVPLFALQRFAVDRIKIDRSLVLGVEADEQKDRAAKAILALAKVMQVQTVATGVETRHEMEHLSKIGFDHLQGFGIARPIKSDQIANWLSAREKSGKPILLDQRRAG